jgi:hypothetical protein
MAIELIGTTTDEGANAASLSMYYPTGWKRGDLLLTWLFMVFTGLEYQFETPTGWTVQDEVEDFQGTYADIHCSLQYRIIQEHDEWNRGDWDYYWGNADGTSGIMTCWRGINASSPFETNANILTSNGDATPDAPNVTCSTGNMCVTMLGASENDITTNGPPSGFTSAGAFYGTAYPDRQSLVAYDLSNGSPGSWTHSVNNNNSSLVRASVSLKAGTPFNISNINGTSPTPTMKIDNTEIGLLDNKDETSLYV